MQGIFQDILKADPKKKHVFNNKSTTGLSPLLRAPSVSRFYSEHHFSRLLKRVVQHLAISTGMDEKGVVPERGQEGILFKERP